MFRTRLARHLPCLVFLLALTAAPAAAGWLDLGKQLFGGAASEPQPTTALSTEEIGSGLKEALQVGAERVVARLGQADGFNADPAVHIPLPEQLKGVKTMLGAVGMGAMLDDLELRLNRAAEAATPQAKELFGQAIREMTLEDVQGIYNGPSDAATRYFEGKMSGPLAEAMRPVVNESLSQVGAVQAYDRVMGQYAALPLVPDVKADLSGHVVDRGMAGIFHYLAQEEAAIRENPAKRTTELLQRVFTRP